MANKRIEEIEDLDVIHIIVEDNLDCYLALGVVHSIYTPLIGKLKDYISSPKYNMYQALHTIVIAPTGSPIKIAISTKVMKSIYSVGIASKWKYCEEKGYCKEEEQEDIRNHLNIIKELDRINMVDGVDSNTYVKILEEDVFNKSQYIYVYSTKGEVIVLPTGATVLDFAFKVDSISATRISRLLINGLECSFNTKLKNGCIVGVKYGPKITINEEWLNDANSNYTKMKIKEYLDI
jgi:GTP pyrophosphokinase